MPEIIDSSDPGIVIRETKVTISDEKLSKMLLKAYEAAQNDFNEFKIFRYWSVCFSISGTIVLTILTSEFRPIGVCSADTVFVIAVVLSIVFFILGMIFLLWRFGYRVKNDTILRDKAVQRIIEDVVKDGFNT